MNIITRIRLLSNKCAQNVEKGIYFNDLLVEGKSQLVKQNEVPIALILAGTIPSGDEQVSSGASDYGIKVASAYNFN